MQCNIKKLCYGYQNSPIVAGILGKYNRMFSITPPDVTTKRDWYTLDCYNQILLQLLKRFNFYTTYVPQ